MRGRVVGGAVAAVAVAAVLGGGGWLVVQRQAHEMVEQGVARFREHLGPDTTFSYASATPSVLHRNARFAGVVLAGPDSTVRADTVVVGCDAASVCSGTADAVTLATPDAAAVSGSAEHVGWTRLSVPSADGEDGAAAGAATGGATGGALGGRFDAAEARGVRLAGGGGEVGIAALALADYGAGRRGRGSVDGVTMSLPDPSAGAAPGGVVRLRLGHAAFDGVDVAAVAGAMRAGTAVPAAAGRQTLEASGLDVAQGEAPLLHVGRVTSFTDTAAPGTAAGAVPGSAPGATSGAQHGVGDVTELRLEGPPALLAGLQELGYARFEGDLHVDATLDRAAGAMTIATWRLVGVGMGQATLSGGFDHLPLGGGAAPDPAAMLGLTVRGFDLVLVDAGLTGRVLEAKAKASGTDAATLRALVAGQVGSLPVASPAAQSVRAALAAFVRAPGTLTLGVHPAAPVSLLDVAQVAGRGPDGVVAALGVTAAAK